MNTNNGINCLSLFDGIRCGMIALEKAGVKVNKYYSSEVDEYAMKIADKNYPEHSGDKLGDVTKIDIDKLNSLMGIDLLIGGSPCTNFSFAGKRNGMSTTESIEVLTLEQYLELKKEGFEFKGQSYLFWEYIRILNEVKPKYFMLENVVMSKKWKDIITNTLGVEPIKINSKLVIPQSRNRLYWTNIPNVTQPEDKNIKLKDIMLKENDPLLEIRRPSEKRMDYVQRKIDKGWLKVLYRDSLTEYSDCLMASMYKQMQEFIWKCEDGSLRFFTPIECERLQTIPDNYTSGVSNTQRYKSLGNGWTVDVVAHILKGLKDGDCY